MLDLLLDYSQLTQTEKQKLDLIARFHSLSHAETALLIANQQLGGMLNQHFDYLAEHNPDFLDFIQSQKGGKYDH